MWKKYDDEFKCNALQKVFDGQSVRWVAEELGVNESIIHKWKRASLSKGDGNRSGAELAETEVLKKAESFFSRFKAELIEDGVFEDLAQARSEIFSYIEGYYNRVRLHSSLGYKSPIEFEMELETKNGGNERRFFV